MNLPPISIPIETSIIPFDIPTMFHQPLVHFAIAIPVIILLIEIVNLFVGSKALKVTTAIFLLLLVGILFGAYLTGTTDGKHAIDNGFNAMGELKEHKLIGIYLFYGSIIIFVFKLLELLINRVGFRIFYILLLIGFVASILYQGKEGGELVFEHGANVQITHDDFEEEEESVKVQKVTPTSQTQEDKKQQENTQSQQTKQNEDNTSN